MSSEELNLSLSGENLKCRTGDTDLCPQAVRARGFGGVLVGCCQTPSGWEELGESLRILSCI